MKKYSFEFKMKIVNEYLDGKGSQNSIARKYNVDDGSVNKWIRYYKVHGESILKNTEIEESHSVKSKLHAIELYKTSDISYNELAVQLGIKSHNSIRQWVKNYDAKGIEGISRTRSAPSKMAKKEDYSPEEKQEIKELKEKLLKSEIERKFLKELWSLENEMNEDTETKKSQE